MVALFVVTSFTAASLVFMIQPLVAKMVLPSFGGSPTVWTTTSLFFQTALLAGYAYVHVSTKAMPGSRQPLVHVGLALLPLLALPVALPDDAAPAAGDSPALWLLRVLLITVGAPFLLISTSGPLLQRWFSWTGHPRRHDPYFLYAAGNIGSIVGLFAYPFLLEPRTTLAQQAGIWSGGYVLVVVLLIACAVLSTRARRTADAGPPSSAAETAAVAPPAASEPVTARRRATWVAWAFLPSALMLGATATITVDLAPVPLLWVVPLALYLLTFVIAFARSSRALTAVSSRGGAIVAIAGVLLVMFVPVSSLPVSVGITVHLLALTLVGLAAHGRLALDRPGTARLTEFYVWVAVGGAGGGLLGSLLAPAVFDSAVEYPLVLACVPLLVLAGRGTRRRRSVAAAETATETDVVPDALSERRRSRARLRKRVFTAAAAACVVIFAVQFSQDPSLAAVFAVMLVAAAVLVLPRPRWAAALTVLVVAGSYGLATTGEREGSRILLRERTFFASYVVSQDDDTTMLQHGTTIHGRQSRDPELAGEPSTYYARSGPLGDIFATLDGGGGRLDDVAVVGLGTGTVASYGRSGQTMDFYEIDQAIVDMAQDPRYFTYLSDSAAEISTTTGDGRLGLESAETEYDLIVLDAFSSDAVPAHLLTAEALAGYRERLAPGGVVAVHVSNRHLKLAPTVAAGAKEAGMDAVERLGKPTRDDERRTGATPADWMVVSTDASALDTLDEVDGWEPVDPTQARPWTDSYSSLWSVRR